MVSGIHFISKETRELSHAIRQSERQIDLIHEYRERLISDVVTGALDVRDVEIPSCEEGIIAADDAEDHDEEIDLDDADMMKEADAAD